MPTPPDLCFICYSFLVTRCLLWSFQTLFLPSTSPLSPQQGPFLFSPLVLCSLGSVLFWVFAHPTVPLSWLLQAHGAITAMPRSFQISRPAGPLWLESPTGTRSLPHTWLFPCILFSVTYATDLGVYVTLFPTLPTPYTCWFPPPSLHDHLSSDSLTSSLTSATAVPSWLVSCLYIFPQIDHSLIVMRMVTADTCWTAEPTLSALHSSHSIPTTTPMRIGALIRVILQDEEVLREHRRDGGFLAGNILSG